MENKIMKGILDTLFQIVTTAIIYFIYSVSLDLMFSISQVELEKNLSLAFNITGAFILTVQTVTYFNLKNLSEYSDV